MHDLVAVISNHCFRPFVRRLHNVVMSRQQDKQNLAALEKKLSEEKKLREKTESQLANERKTKKQEDQVAARAVALASANR